MVRAARRDVEGSACDFRPSLRRAPRLRTVSAWFVSHQASFP
jgi:hypothetical protein